MRWPGHESGYALAIICAVVVVGFVSELRKRIRLDERLTFARAFQGHFRNYLNGRGLDHREYEWLITNSPKMQIEIGGHGVYARFEAPFANYAITNYPIILNMIPEIRRLISDNEMGLWNRNIANYGTAVDEALMRYIGYLSDSRPSPSHLFNPFVCFREGVRLILAGPLILLVWFGIAGSGLVARLTHSGPFMALSSVVAILGFVGTAFTIVLGWHDMTALVGQWVPFLAKAH